MAVELLTAIVGFIVFVLTAIFEVIAKLLSLVGINLPRTAFRKILISLGCLTLAYLALGLALIYAHVISSHVKENLFSGGTYAVILLINMLIWLGIFGNVGADETISDKLNKTIFSAWFAVSIFVPIITVFIGVTFFTISDTFWAEENRRTRIAKCEQTNTKTTSVFDKVSKSLKLDNEIADAASKLLKDKCK